MSDIFISYSRLDRERARLLAGALEGRGWSVWWDHDIPPGRVFDDVIEEALAAARCVVVLWSKTSSASSWVRNEASEAMQRKVLIPALIDVDVKIPLEFRRLQAADLSRWQGGSTDEFEQFCEAVASNVGAPATPRGGLPPVASRPRPPERVEPPAQAPVQPPAVAAPAVKSKRAIWIWSGVGLLLLAGLGSYVSDLDAGRQMPRNGMPQAQPMLPQRAPAATGWLAPAGFTNLSWRDNALSYKGTLTVDGRSNIGQLSVDVFDSQTGRSLGHRSLQAFGRPDAPGRNVFSTEIEVDGDSSTRGPHTHSVTLVFEQQANGFWQFMRDCMAPGDCYEVR